MLMFQDMLARLERAYSIPDDQRTKFRARVRNFKRLGWPTPAKRQAGKYANWSEREYVEMAIVAELMALGITPERAIEIARSNYSPLYKAAEQGGVCEISVPPVLGKSPKSTIRLDFSAVKPPSP